MVKVRFAPSPTGTLHVGGIRTALFNYFFAKAQGGIFVLRNEDTDQSRKIEGSLDATIESLRWLGISWEEMITQSDRLSEYQKFAKQLVERGLAQEEDGAIRFHVDKSIGTISWHDQIGSKEISYDANNIEDFIILKADGYPTYHLANVIDDHLMEITHVLRGEDWIPSTPKHLLLYKAFGWEIPAFAHLPNVMGTDGKKLSKRRGAKSVIDFKNEGFLPEALLNYLMLLGWSPKNDREILKKEEIEKEFTLSNVNSAPAIFDERKLLWMNGEYIREIQNSKLKIQILEFDPELKKYDQELLEKLIEPAKTRMKLLSEFKGLITPFIDENFRTPESDSKKALSLQLEAIDQWDSGSILAAIKTFLEENNMRFPDLYEVIIGARQGLPLADVFEIMGKQRTLGLLK